jgi:hypothetical protein
MSPKRCRSHSCERRWFASAVCHDHSFARDLLGEDAPYFVLLTPLSSEGLRPRVRKRKTRCFWWSSERPHPCCRPQGLTMHLGPDISGTSMSVSTLMRRRPGRGKSISGLKLAGIGSRQRNASFLYKAEEVSSARLSHGCGSPMSARKFSMLIDGVNFSTLILEAKSGALRLPQIEARR